MQNISSDVIRGYNDPMILYLLWEKPSYGYVIKETTLYSAFTRMERNGYIASFSNADNAAGKRRTYYRITDAGRAYYREKCAEWRLTQEVVEKFIKNEEAFYGND